MISTQVLWLLEGEAVHMRKVNEHAGLTLEGTAAFIWRLFTEPRTIEELVEQVVAHYSVSRDAALKDTGHFVNSLLSEGFLERYSPPAQFVP